MVIRDRLIVGAVPPAKSQYDPNDKVRDPVLSCTKKIDPDCPAVRLLGLASVTLVPSVSVKLLLSAKSGVTVDPLVSVVISPRCPAGNVCAVSLLALSAS